MSQCRWGYRKISIIFIFHSVKCDRCSEARSPCQAHCPRVMVFVAFCWHFLFGYNLYRTQFRRFFDEYECRFADALFRLMCFISTLSFERKKNIFARQPTFDCISNGFTKSKSQRAYERLARLCLCLLRSFGFWLIKYTTTKSTVREQCGKTVFCSQTTTTEHEYRKKDSIYIKYVYIHSF